MNTKRKREVWIVVQTLKLHVELISKHGEKVTEKSSLKAEFEPQS